MTPRPRRRWLAYGDHPEQIGELTLPEAADGALPVVALWHGGSFERA